MHGTFIVNPSTFNKGYHVSSYQSSLYARNWIADMEMEEIASSYQLVKELLCILI
jgi:hypothetical protein